MLLSRVPFKNISENEFNIIYKELGIDQSKINHTLTVIKDWLKLESHLPNDVDENLLINFIMKCKGNLQKSEEKLERFLIARSQMPNFFTDRIIGDTIDPYMTHRFVCVSKKLTPDGYRTIILRFPMRDPTHLDELKGCKYFILLLEALLYHDKCAGYHYLCDVSNANVETMGKLNLTLQKNLAQIMYLILPFRVRSVHILNGNVAFDILLNLAKSLMPKKLKERVFNTKIVDLPKYFPAECLPGDYGGTDQTCDELCEEWLEIFKENKKWCKETEGLKLAGSLPENLKKLYSSEEFGMAGSFRKLNLD